MSFEVAEPIQNGPFDKPERYWYIAEGEHPDLRHGRRASVVFPPRDQRQEWELDPLVMRPSQEYRNGYELVLVNLIRERVADWQAKGFVCPNVTIKTRLQELDPQRGDASVYRTRDLVPPHLMPLLGQGRVVVTNWHVFEPHIMQTGGTTSKVSRAGKPVRVREKIVIGQKNTTARGSRYMTPTSLAAMHASGEIEVVAGSEVLDEQENLRSVPIVSEKYVESDTAVVSRIFGREVGGKQNILIMNDEAHHAYRIRQVEPDEDELELDEFGDEEDAEDFFQEATVWIDGLDKVQKLRGINCCIGLSATSYFLGRVGQDTNRPFPWVVSDFSLIEAIESGLVKVPQLAVRDTTGEEVPGYFNIWHWLIPKLTPAERGATRGSPKPEAVLKYAYHPIAMLGGMWQKMLAEWGIDPEHDTRPPVFILVCKNTAIARVMHEWLGQRTNDVISQSVFATELLSSLDVFKRQPAA